MLLDSPAFEFDFNNTPNVKLTTPLNDLAGQYWTIYQSKVGHQEYCLLSALKHNIKALKTDTKLIHYDLEPGEYNYENIFNIAVKYIR